MANFSTPLFPVPASEAASKIDLLLGVLIAVSAGFAFVIFSTMIYSCIRYRHGSRADRSLSKRSQNWLELTWTVIPLAIGLVLFTWAAELYFEIERPPREALEIYAVGKQWMWKFQHSAGPRELNELHLPAGMPVRLTLISQDVIHSFFVPAFRVKRDVLPNRLQSVWFIPTRPGEYHLFCAEYCGTQHSRMKGKVVVLPKSEYSRWVSNQKPADSPLLAGQRLFDKLGCAQCHAPGENKRGPDLSQLYGRTVQLTNGDRIRADEEYLGESISDPGVRLTANYSAIMPSYLVQLNPEQMLQLVAYIKSLRFGPALALKSRQP